MWDTSVTNIVVALFLGNVIIIMMMFLDEQARLFMFGILVIFICRLGLDGARACL
ncbi:hypothetical protein [uncultured Brachyspira sp.]|uniref:hypothetical protein n=1 Tax=uncultured Brachyspira sp. TaxID=221953 RepID=UPI002622B28B|nr:hypothetical protein [uncultured Brachyspira sp.]